MGKDLDLRTNEEHILYAGLHNHLMDDNARWIAYHRLGVGSHPQTLYIKSYEGLFEVAETTIDVLVDLNKALDDKLSIVVDDIRYYGSDGREFLLHGIMMRMSHQQEKGVDVSKEAELFHDVLSKLPFGNRNVFISLYNISTGMNVDADKLKPYSVSNH